MNDQNQSTDKLLFIYINLEMPVMQNIYVEQGIRFLKINGFASLLIIINIQVKLQLFSSDL